jgi:hypothetical protein
MNAQQKALVSRELAKASTALHNAHMLAVHGGDMDLAAALMKDKISVATQITALSGGPVRVTGAELLKHPPK